MRSRPARSYWSGSRSDDLIGATIRMAISPKISPSSSPKAMMGRRRRVILYPGSDYPNSVYPHAASSGSDYPRSAEPRSLAWNVPLDSREQLVQAERLGEEV